MSLLGMHMIGIDLQFICHQLNVNHVAVLRR